MTNNVLASKQSGRLAYIDMAKGFAIVLMVLGHTYSVHADYPFMVWIYSFHMPLFFLTTGILYGLKMKKDGKLNLHFGSKCKTLLLPYVLYNTLYQLLVGSLRVIGGAPAKETILLQLMNVVYLRGSAMWFLPVMFLASCLFLATVNRKWVNISVSAAALAAGVFLKTSNDFLAALLNACVGLSFITIGFYAVDIFTTKRKIVYPAVIFLLSLFPVFVNKTVSIASRTFHNPLLYLLNSCAGTWVVYQLCMHLEKTAPGRLLRYWGANSIKILCFHSFVIQVIRLLDYKLFEDILPRLGMWEGAVFTGIIMAILTCTMPVINRLLNWSFGIRRNPAA